MGGVSHRWFLSFKVIIFTLDVWQDILRKTDPGFSLCTFSLGLAGTVLVTLVLTLSSSSPVNDCQLRPRWGVECWLAPGPGQRAAGWPCQRVSLHLRSFLKILGLDRFTLNRFLPIPILTDSETFNITDTDTDSEK